MKEPALEEEALRRPRPATAARSGSSARPLGDTAEPVTVTAPSGKTRTLTLNPDKPGLFAAAFEADELGLHTLRAGSFVAFVSVGPANPRELVDVFSDTERLRPLAEATGGSVRRLAEAGGGLAIPRLQIARSGRLSGSDWIGFRRATARWCAACRSIRSASASRPSRPRGGGPGDVAGGGPARAGVSGSPAGGATACRHPLILDGAARRRVAAEAGRRRSGSSARGSSEEVDETGRRGRPSARIVPRPASTPAIAASGASHLQSAPA